VRLRVLGSAAGGGFPQWNCGCVNCAGLRGGTVRARARRQESVAIRADDRAGWLLVNCSPEVRAQIEGFEGLWPRGRRDSPIAGIVLTNGDLDHCLGLLSLRESHPLLLYATAEVRRGFTEDNVLYRTLERFEGQTTWLPLELGRPRELPGGLTMTAVPVPGKRPIHLERVGTPGPEDNVGLVFRQGPHKTLAYFPAVAAWTAALAAELAQADVVFFDGTFWSSAELAASGVGTKRAEDMAHLPVGGPEGSLARLRGLPARRKILIHINNTNPLLREDSPERAQALEAGVEIAVDDLEVEV